MQLSQVCVEHALGEPQAHRNMTIVPIKAVRGGRKSDLDYRVLSEGLQSGQVDIRETQNVNQLYLSNNSAKDLLLMKGEYVIGGGQNRMITVNGLIQAYTGRIYIPVHCVQHGRWNPREGDKFGLASFAVSAELRSSVVKSASGRDGQSRTWGFVESKLVDCDVRSPTQNYDDIHTVRNNDINYYLRAFSKVQGQIGAVAVVQYRDGQTRFFVDMFDQARTFGKHYERLIASYAMEAIAQGTSNHAPVDRGHAARFLERTLAESTHESMSISLGTDHEINGNGILGAGLVYEGTLLYLGAKNSERISEPKPDVPFATRRGAI